MQLTMSMITFVRSTKLMSALYGATVELKKYSEINLKSFQNRRIVHSSLMKVIQVFIRQKYPTLTKVLLMPHVGKTQTL